MTRLHDGHGCMADTIDLRQSPCLGDSSQSQRLIGLTGGIGMGKTTVSDYLATQHHLPILDADLFARAAVEPKSAIVATLVERYGSGILQADGSLNRLRLGNIVFNSPPERLWLEQQIHPFVRDRFIASLTQPPLSQPEAAPIVVLVVPLLFEARMTDLVNEIWVVTCPLAVQLERLMQRDRLTLEQAQKRIDSQMPIQRKLVHADVVLTNASTPEALFQQIDRALMQPVTGRSALLQFIKKKS